MLRTFTIFAGRNLNLSELARQNGLRRAHLHHIFNFRRTPSLLYAIRLSRALDMSLDEFVAALARRRLELERKDVEKSDASSRQLAHKVTASANGEKRVRPPVAVRGQQIRTFRGGHETLTSMAWSPDGRTLASAGYDKAIRLWEVASGKIIRRLLGHQNAISTVAWNPDGRALASGDLDGVVRLWETANGSLIQLLQLDQSISTLAWSPDGKILASGGLDGAIRLWDLAGGILIHTLRTDRNLLGGAGETRRAEPIFLRGLSMARDIRDN